MDVMLLGGAAFALFFLYDANSVLWKRPLLRAGFPVGCLLLAAAVAWDTLSAWPAGPVTARLVLGLALAAAGLGLLVYTLFFAIPFDETYRDAANRRRPVCDRGMYALCRHPGVLWLFWALASLALACGSPPMLGRALGLSCLNLFYVVFQDLWTFPRTFSDYARYRATTPFLLPTPTSVRRAWRTRPGQRRAI